MNRFDELFSLKDITTYSNTLGITEDVRKSYVGFTRKILNEHNVKKSQNVKLNCYQTIFPKIEKRKKFTGFEKFVDLEFKIRIKLLSMTSPNPDTSVAYDNNHKHISTPEEYVDLLVSEIKKEKKEKLLYFSGGLDSELLAYILLNNDIEFTPVIFQLLDNNDEVSNAEEISYAINFCKKFCITPIIENLYIEDFWTSDEFFTMAKEFNIVSPHVLTHAKMILIMNEKFPDHAHYFGGEVRYIMDIPRNEETKLDLVFSEKLAKDTLWYFPAGPLVIPEGFSNSVTTNSVTSLLWYGWTNMALAIVGGGGSGGLKIGAVAGGGGGGGQARTVTLTKPSATWIRAIFVTAGKGGIPTAGQEGYYSSVSLFEDTAGFTVWKSMQATGGGAGYGSFDPGRGGYGKIGNNNGSPTADNGSSLTIDNGQRIGGNGNAASGLNNGGGGGSGAAFGGDPTVSAGGNGADGQFVNLAITGNPTGQFGAGGGGGANQSTSATGGIGGLGFESSSVPAGGDGGDGSALGNGQNGVNYFGAGGGGQGGGSSAGSGSQGLIRMQYWRT
jgi:hypothetical protein